VTLFSQVTGVVMSVHYREGQLVHVGDPLVDIDPRPSEATLTQAEGQLLHDQGVLDQATMDLERYQAAYARNAIAKQLLDDQEKAVIQDEGTVKSDQGTVAFDKVQLAYCHIVSPINGRVGLRLVDPGNTIFSGSNSTLVVITQLQPITVVFNVSEDTLPELQTELKGNKAMEVDAFDRADEKNLEAGKLTSLDNEIDTTTGTVKFRANFQNKNLDLFPNQFVNARLLERTLTNATLAPTAAVQYNGTAAFVYIVNPNNTVSVQPVQVVTGNDKVTAVTGVNTGVTVATSGFDRLENGVHVQVHQSKPKTTTPSAGMGPSTGGSTTP
jgi:multidrug efflux system membrane fusion protein